MLVDLSQRTLAVLDTTTASRSKPTIEKTDREPSTTLVTKTLIKEVTTTPATTAAETITDKSTRNLTQTTAYFPVFSKEPTLNVTTEITTSQKPVISSIKGLPTINQTSTTATVSTIAKETSTTETPTTRQWTSAQKPTTKQWTSAKIPPAQKTTTKKPSIAGKMQTATYIMYMLFLAVCTCF